MDSEKTNVEKRVKLSVLIYTILIILVFIVGIGSVLAYGTETEIGKKIAAKVSETIPFPAAIIERRHVVYLKDMQNNLISIEKFYKTEDFSQEGLRIDFTTDNGKKRLKIKEKDMLNKMIEDKIIEIIAKKKGISISQKDVDVAVQQKLKELGTENEFKNDLFASYGWSIEDFKQKVILPNSYKDALMVSVAQKGLDNSKPKEKIQQARSELEKGKDFADVVNNYSEGSSKEKKGELGWVKKSQLNSELQKALFDLKPLEKNSIIESSIGFHIVDIENKKKENNEDVLQLRQIFVSKITFADWLENEKKKMSVIIPLRDFVWDDSNGTADFKDEQMRKFEKEERSRAQGDASIMF